MTVTLCKGEVGKPNIGYFNIQYPGLPAGTYIKRFQIQELGDSDGIGADEMLDDCSPSPTPSPKPPSPEIDLRSRFSGKVNWVGGDDLNELLVAQGVWWIKRKAISLTRITYEFKVNSDYTRVYHCGTAAFGMVGACNDGYREIGANLTGLYHPTMGSITGMYSWKGNDLQVTMRSELGEQKELYSFVNDDDMVKHITFTRHDSPIVGSSRVAITLKHDYKRDPTTPLLKDDL